MDDFREYIHRYAVCRGISEAEAETHLIVQSYKEYLKIRDKDKDDRTETIR